MARPRPRLRLLPALVATLLAALLGLLLVSVTTGARPPFPEPVDGQRVLVGELARGEHLAAGDGWRADDVPSLKMREEPTAWVAE